MNIISFIKNTAFITSCILKLVLIPFMPIYYLMRKLKKCVNHIKLRIKRYGENQKKDEKKSKTSFLKKKNNLLYKISVFILRSIFRFYHFLYWKYYYVSRKLYQKILKNTWCEIYFMLVKEYMKPTPASFSCYDIISIKKYAKQSDDVDIEIIQPSQVCEVCIPEFFECSEEKNEKYISPDIYLATVPNVSVIGGSNVVIAKKYLLNDAVANDLEKRLDIRYASIKAVLNHTVLVEDAIECINIEKAINLVGAASFNYYHLIVEILSRLTFVDRNERYADYPILVDEIVLKIPQYKAALFCINKGKHKIIAVKKGQQCNIHVAVLPSSNVWMPTNIYNRDTIRNSDFLISKEVLNNIRSSVQLYDEKRPFRKIFVSRKNTQTVRLRNEESIREIFKENGFEIVYTEELTFQEQVEYFGQASCVVAASGAALTNIIFCQPGTIIGCIIPEEHHFYMYSTIAHLLGLIPFFLKGKIVEKTPYAAGDSFILDKEYTCRYIMELKNRMNREEKMNAY